MTKVKVSKEVAEALEYYKAKSNNWYEQVLIEVLKSKEGYTSSCEAIVLDNNFTMMELANVLLNGHEVELTTVEKWNKSIEYIKEQIDYSAKNCLYQEECEYEIELHTIKAINNDFNLGLKI